MTPSERRQVAALLLADAIARHIQIAADLAQENEELRESLKALAAAVSTER